MNQQALTVSELTKQIKYALELDFDRVLLQGEISNIAFPRSGHVYFNIKDENAQISAVMFRSSAQRVRFEMENGLELLIKGRITVYEPRGQYQLIVDRVDPLGEGALQFAFEQLKAKLAAEGLFDAEHKQSLPFIPKGIGIVTSSTGAAIQDMLNVLNRRFPNIPVLLNPVAVQGDEAAPDIARAIKQFQSIPDIDLLIVGRGGGSIEDLWAFNEEIVARAIFNSKIPIISAVGHETDFTITDFVADLRAPTPSAAAELSVPVKEELVLKVDQLKLGLTYNVRRRLNRYQERLEYLKKRLRSPAWVIQAKSQRLDDLTEKLDKVLSNRISQYRSRCEKAQQALKYLSPQTQVINYRARVTENQRLIGFRFKEFLEKRKTRLSELTHVLETVSPLSVLTRGYAVAADPDQKPIKSIHQIETDSTLFVHVSDGTIQSNVEKTIPKKNNH